MKILVVILLGVVIAALIGVGMRAGRDAYDDDDE
jgi:hypothetical protein